MNESPMRAGYAALDLLASAVLVIDRDGVVAYANLALEDLLKTSRRLLIGHRLDAVFPHGELDLLYAQARDRVFDLRRQDVRLAFAHRDSVLVNASAVALEEPGLAALFEFREADQQLKFDREERYLEQGQANRELIRNLAHEIKNPLGGIRGAAQLLEFEISDDERARELREYTQVIVKEADRLQTLVDRLLAPHRRPQIVANVNIHEVCERVRSVLLAEHPHGLRVERDYDVSVPEFPGDKEQLIQALLNIAQNAAQALAGQMGQGARITLRSRIGRNVTINKARWRLALDLHVVDNGPGIPDAIRERIFLPLVSGREGGSGLGLTLAQTFVHQHQGIIECDSRPGLTDFRILIPLS